MSRLSGRISTLLCLLFVLHTSLAARQSPWPLESEAQATNLTSIAPEFRDDLSGATWNPVTRTLWLCRNGPREDSRLWVLAEDEAGELRIDEREGVPGEWRELGDSEGVAFAAFDEEVVYLIVEGEESIHEVDVSTYGEHRVTRVFDTSPYLPLEGSAGAEGITFVTDEWLTDAGFCDQQGAVRTSRNGMGGLMLVGHQNGGGIYAFDLNRTTGAVDFVGEYRILDQRTSDGSPISRVVGLEFDRSSGQLLVWHGLDDDNRLSIVSLSSVPREDREYRVFGVAKTFEGPSDRSIEGIAVQGLEDCGPQGRALFLTVDDGKSNSLFRYDSFGPGCPGVKPAAASPAKDESKSSPIDIAALLFSLVGGLGLFLVGMRNLSEGMQAIAGSRLRQMIGAVTDNRFLAIGVGTTVTCLVQSSSITTVIVIGFVNSGLMQLRQAIGVIIGANIGTTVTGWILVLKVGKYGLPILGISAFFYLFSKRERWRYVAMAIMGLGMIFFGLELMKNGVKPMRDVPAFQEAFAWFTASSYIGVLKCAAAGCFLTLILQSSSATLGITISLAATGAIPFETAAALVLGENVGTTITAWLASIGATTIAKRAAYAHVAFNLFGVFWITLIFGAYTRFIARFVEWKSGADVFGADFTFDNPDIAFATIITFAIASVHTGFNVTNTILFVGILPRFADMLERFLPDREKKESPSLILDHSLIASPVLSIENSFGAIIKLARGVDDMLSQTRELLQAKKPDEAQVQKVFDYEAKTDAFQAETIQFLTDLLSAETPHDVAVEARQQLRIVDEYESITDYVSSILKARLRLEKHGLNVTEEELAQLLKLHDDVASYVRRISLGFEHEHEQDLARSVAGGLKIKRATKVIRNQHLESLSQQVVDPIQSMAFSTMLNGYRKVKDHALNIAESLATS